MPTGARSAIQELDGGRKVANTNMPYDWQVGNFLRWDQEFGFSVQVVRIGRAAAHLDSILQLR
jgi:hypothetical protein